MSACICVYGGGLGWGQEKGSVGDATAEVSFAVGSDLGYKMAIRNIVGSTVRTSDSLP